MKKNPKSVRPGDMLDGRRGDWWRPANLADGSRCRQHMQDIKDASGRVIRSVVCGLEYVSKARWWLDDAIMRPPLQDADWDFRVKHGDKKVPLNDSLFDWQLPWAWQYECWREWQPWSDFDETRRAWERWQNEHPPKGFSRRNRKKYSDQGLDVLGFAAYHRCIPPLWILQYFDQEFPHTPWVKIQQDRRDRLKEVEPPCAEPPPLIEGSLLALKEYDAEGRGAEVIKNHGEWCDTSRPGIYRDQKVEQVTEGVWLGTYIIRIPWHKGRTALKNAFLDWMERNKPFEKWPKLPDRRQHLFEWLLQLGVLRMLRVMSAKDADKLTRKALQRTTSKGEGVGRYVHLQEYSAAKSEADKRLAAFFGV